MWRALGEIAQVNSGYPFRGKVENDPDGTVVIIQQRDVSDMVAMSPEDLAGCAPTNAAWLLPDKSHGKYLIASGDVLLQARGGQFHCLQFTGNYAAMAAQGVAVLRPQSGLLAEYLCWYLNHPTTTKGLQNAAGGTHIPFLSKKALSEYRVPVPSLEVQQQIASADVVHRQYIKKTQRLLELNNQLINAATWQAAIANTEE